MPELETLAAGDRAVHDRLHDAGARWRELQPAPRRVDATIFAMDRAARGRPAWLARVGTFLAGAATAAVLIGVGISVTPLGGRGPAGPGAAATGVDACPLTIPHWTGTALPPDDWGIPGSGNDWLGTPKLATMLATVGTQWNGLPHSDRGYAQKTFWWREGYRPSKEPQPEISVTGKRLDGPGAFAFGPGTNASASDIGSAMLVGIDIPATGCWQITGTYRGDALSYVVWVGP